MSPEQIEALERLAQLRSTGALSENEFADLKASILGGEFVTSYDVVIRQCFVPTNKAVEVCNLLTHTFPGLHRSEALLMMRNSGSGPVVVARGVDAAVAKDFQKRLQALGGIVELHPA